MAEPITVAVETDPAALAEIAFDYMESAIPGWSRSRGDPDAKVIEACAQLIAEGSGPASDVSLAILRYLGQWVDGLPPIDATPAQTTATVTALDDEGYEIPDGTRFEIRTSGDTGQVFLSVGTVTIPPLSTSTAAGEVVLVAETPGAAGSGLSAASTVVPVEALAWIDTVTLTALTTGGVDAETDEEYLARWILLRQLSNDTPILAEDAAALLRALIPGISRTLPLDNYDPVADAFGVEKYVTVAVADVTGEPVAGALKAAAEALLESKRELNFVANVIDADYETFDVVWAATSYEGFDTDDVEEIGNAALAAYLYPGTFSTPAIADATVWIAKTHLRYLELAAALDRVEGLDEITSLVFGRARSVTAVAATDIFTSTAHGFVLDTPISFRALTGGAPLVAGTTYFARDITANTFKVSLTAGGAAVNITSDLSAGLVRTLGTTDVPLPQPAPLTRPGTISGTVT